MGEYASIVYLRFQRCARASRVSISPSSRFMRNIVLLITDTFRYDNLSGRSKAKSPNLDEFARSRATSLDGMYTGSFPTIPHRTEIATGRGGWPHYGWQPIDVSSRNHIGTILSGAGYATQLICDCPHLFKARFDAGFDAAYHVRGQEGDRPLLHLNDPIAEIIPPEKTRRGPLFRGHPLADIHRWTNRYTKTEAETFAARTGSTAIRWLEENYESGPFFLWVDFFDPHEPWDPPEYMVRKYMDRYDGIPMIHPNYGPSTEFTDAELENLRAHYFAEAELVDRWIGRVIEKLDDLAMWDDTILVITTDHGMSLGEHGRTGKSNIHPDDSRFCPIYPEVSHIPFLIAAADVPSGVSLDLRMQPMDVMPTLFSLAGVPTDVNVPDGFDGRACGEELIHSRAGAVRHCSVAGCHLDLGESRRPPRGATMPFLVKDEWGFAPIGACGASELYDLSIDPLAKNDIACDNSKIVDELRREFLRYLRNLNAPASLVEIWDSASSGDGTWAIDYE